MQSFEEEIKGKQVLVFGLGRQGGGAGDAAWLTKHGAIVRVADRDLSLAPGGEKEEDIHWADYIIKNPGVPDDHPLLILARSHHKPVLTSIAVFVKYAPLKIIGITGTRGKSTTTTLISTLLECAYPGQVVTGGNIPGTSGLTLFEQSVGKKYAVLELSSFQLHNFHDLKVSPDIAIITNLYPDHLNRYTNMENYQKDKEAICQYQQASDLCLYNADNPGAAQIAQISPARKVSFSATEVISWATSLPGLHNRENIAAMWTVGKELGIAEELCRQVVQDFHGIPFRQEKIREVEGVVYINDTTATTPTAAIKALQAASTPTIWITGGDTKNLPFDNLIEEVKHNKHLKKIVILGSKNIPDYTAELKSALGEKIAGTASSMQEAIELARSSTVFGDTVLLSPGFASFDLFQNEFDRGRQFNEIVQKL